MEIAAEFMKFPEDDDVSARTARNRRRIRLTSRGLEEQQRQKAGKPPVQLPAAPFEADWADKGVKLQDRPDDDPCFEADAKKHIAVQFRPGEPMRPIDMKRTPYLMVNGERRRLTLDEFVLIAPGTVECVIGEEHHEVHRKIVSRLWPDLIAGFLLGVDTSAVSEANRRFREWTGMKIPESHRNWRALAEWADLEPPEHITEDWLLDFLEPRLRVLWAKRNVTSATVDKAPAWYPQALYPRRPNAAFSVRSF
jgi:hypothetical protein